MVIFQGFIHDDIGRGAGTNSYDDKPNAYTNVFVLDYCLTDHYLAIKVADNNYINCADVYFLRQHGYDGEFVEFMKSIYGLHQDGSVTVEGIDDFEYEAECEWKMEYGGYHIKKLTPIMETYLEVAY